MRLDQELVRRGLCASRQEAQECIEQLSVLVANEVALKKTRQVDDQVDIQVLKKRKFVSRGGDKLEGAILHIYPDADAELFTSKNALDIGSSTGGFTDCLLFYGIMHVTGVDVGTSQLHEKLYNNSQVTIHETTDIRNFSSNQLYDVIVADLSFISLEKIIDIVLLFGTTTTEYFLLIKPQFEVGFGNTKKGIVKDITLVEAVLTKYKTLFTEKEFKTIEVFPCIIQGGDGNQEYFIYLKK